MSATIKTSHGEFTGKTVESIVRRVYGRKAWIYYSSSDDPHVGSIVTDAKYNTGMNVQAALYWVEGDRDPRQEQE